MAVNPLVEILLLHALGVIVEGEELRQRTLWTPTPEQGLVPRRRAAAPRCQNQGQLPASLLGNHRGV